jgi:hypothetical protein
MALAIDYTICTLKQLLFINNMHYVLCELGMNFYIQFALTRLRRLATGPSPRRLVFDATLLLVRLLLEEVALGQVLFGVFRFEPVNITLTMLFTHVRLKMVQWVEPRNLPRSNFCRKLWSIEWKCAVILNIFKGLNKHTCTYEHKVSS